MSFFDELKASLEEAVEIKNGVREPARVTRYELADVKAIRAQLNVSQSEMAKVLEPASTPSRAGNRTP